MTKLSEIFRGCTSPSEPLVYVVLQEQGLSLTTEQIAEIAEISVATARKALKTLSLRGYVAETDSKPKGYYVPTGEIVEPLVSEQKVYEPSWYETESETTFHFLESQGLLDSPTLRNRAKTLQEWAKTLRLLVERDGFSEKEVTEVLLWLRTYDKRKNSYCWWIETKNFRSISALRVSRDGELKFTKVLRSYQRERTSSTPKTNPYADPNRFVKR
jgi:hypothetical protein